ncbi:hypothetical protein [Streptomyces sp. NPDC060366]|uniref:hypothetical protein n=1 Tax=Streptomyces sp. NPDC060366 TaxID=3347105 RepID=UPI003647325B
MKGRPLTNGHIDTTAVVLLSLGAVAIYIAYRSERLGSSIAVGAVVIAALYMLLDAGSSDSTTEPPATVPSAPIAPTP